MGLSLHPKYFCMALPGCKHHEHLIFTDVFSTGFSTERRMVVFFPQKSLGNIDSPWIQWIGLGEN